MADADRVRTTAPLPLETVVTPELDMDAFAAFAWDVALDEALADLWRIPAGPGHSHPSTREELQRLQERNWLRERTNTIQDLVILCMAWSKMWEKRREGEDLCFDEAVVQCLRSIGTWVEGPLYQNDPRDRVHLRHYDLIRRFVRLPEARQAIGADLVLRRGWGWQRAFTLVCDDRRMARP
ncbi:hypothetical protein NA57DRAFT_53767 [Rhizodiscina lignyota]|uniref:Uncharacterized protein n=1 Tax=Rhizodiscina lignyota TaxID=1504668 RepID=A0A9P4IKV5_9PEZI|nr:hypothetical protein NA57DRAFT_53767 [Rhizodiscina lignyota]